MAAATTSHTGLAAEFDMATPLPAVPGRYAVSPVRTPFVAPHLV